jgi:cyanamide hydratase
LKSLLLFLNDEYILTNLKLKDNMGWQPHLISREVIEAVTRQLPRLSWSTCFSNQIRKEIEQKPWCHSTAIPGFAEAVAGNEVMKPYE